ncbi:MAG: hypothetical protein K8I27_11690 [Planctomycetes bacterium]|nr:hypothetical protein [Planctomycetota bacterium]
MKPTSRKQLEKVMPGLPFWSNDDFCKLIKSLPKNVSIEMLKSLLTQAADRIGSQTAPPLYRVVSCSQTSASDPCQWDGELVVEGGDGETQAFFIRFVSGSLKLYIDDILIEYVEVEDEPDLNKIGLERVAVLLSRMLLFPDLSGGKLKLIK